VKSARLIATCTHRLLLRELIERLAGKAARGDALIDEGAREARLARPHAMTAGPDLSLLLLIGGVLGGELVLLLRVLLLLLELVGSHRLVPRHRLGLLLRPSGRLLLHLLLLLLRLLLRRLHLLILRVGGRVLRLGRVRRRRRRLRLLRRRPGLSWMAGRRRSTAQGVGRLLLRRRRRHPVRHRLAAVAARSGDGVAGRHVRLDARRARLGRRWHLAGSGRELLSVSALLDRLQHVSSCARPRESAHRRRRSRCGS